MEAAIQSLIEYLGNADMPDLLDEAYMQKSRLKDYNRRLLNQMAAEGEANSIRAALLNICREIDQSGQKPGFTHNQPPVQPGGPPPNHTQPVQPTQQPQYVAQCVMNGDMNQYYVTSANQVVMVNPLNNFATVIASRVPSINANFAWVCMFPNGFYYSVDHNGAIWGVNAYGMPLQMGYVRYF